MDCEQTSLLCGGGKAAAVCFCLALMLAPAFAQETETPTPLSSAAETETPALTPTPTLTATLTETATPAPTASVTDTETPMSTPTATETATETAAYTPTPTATPAATPSPTPSVVPTPEPGWSLLFADDFTSPDPAVWSVPADWALVSVQGDPALYSFHSAQPARLLADLTNVTARASVKIYQGAAALSVRDTGSDYYAARLDAAGGLSLYRGPALLQTAFIDGFDPGLWHTLELAVFHDQLAVRVDGFQSITTSDPYPLLAPGAIALRGDTAGHSKVLFGNAAMSVPAAEMPAGSALLAAESAPFAYITLAQSQPLSSGATSLAFAARVGAEDRFDIFIYDPDNPAVPPVNVTHTPNVDEVCPDISPDGSKIAFSSGGSIWVMDSTTGYSISLLENDGYCPRWQPGGGGRIAFVSTRLGSVELFVRDVIAGAPAQRITTNSIEENVFSWSPDGAYLAFNDLLSGDIFRVATTSPYTQVNLTAGSPVFSQSPVWSKTSSQIAYIANTDGTGQNLHLMDGSGSYIRKLTSVSSGFVFAAMWSPQGRIVFSRVSAGSQTGLYLIADPDAPQPVFLTGSISSVDSWSAAFQPPTPIPTPTPVATCSLNVTQYAAIPLFLGTDAAQSLHDFIERNGITHDGLISRYELRRIRNWALLFNTDLRARYRLENSLSGFVFEPYAIGEVTIEGSYLAHAPFGTSQQYWFVTDYGLLGSCNTPIIIVNGLDFAFQNSVAVTNLYILNVNNDLDDGNGQIVVPPIDTALELGIFLEPYIRGLDEYLGATYLCDINPDCVDRVYIRMIFDANNRFDDHIIFAATREGIPPLFLKLLLMQESNLVPAFTPNAAGAAGIAQFTEIGAQEMVRLGRAWNLENVNNGVQYREYLDGITTDCRSQLTGTAQYPTSEADCVDFSETERAVVDAAFFIRSMYQHMWRLLNNPSHNIFNAWQFVIAPEQETILWLLAAAAYNAGPGTVGAALRNTIIPDGLPLTLEAVCANLPQETQRYIQSIRIGIPGTQQLCSE